MKVTEAEKKLDDCLDRDERLLWKRLPHGGRVRRYLRTVQIAGHAVLTLAAVLFVFYSPMPVMHRVAMGLLLAAVTNAPLIVWARCRLPAIGGGGDAIFFLTDRRVGTLRPGGEIRQAPICPGLSLNVKASVIEFSLGERTPVYFGGLSREEVLLVCSVVEGLIKKCE